jgi:hypothetical protein
MRLICMVFENDLSAEVDRIDIPEVAVAAVVLHRL